MNNTPCPGCGSFNDESAAVCYFCKKELRIGPAQPPQAAAAAPPRPARAAEERAKEYRRPGCVTVYVLLVFFSGVMGIASALYLPTIVSKDPLLLAESWPEVAELDPPKLAFFLSFLKYYLVFSFLYSVLTLLVGWGLWTMRNWARVIILVGQGISLAAGLFALFYIIAVSGGSVFLCGVYSVSLIFPGAVFLWFFLNRRRFR